MSLAARRPGPAEGSFEERPNCWGQGGFLSQGVHCPHPPPPSGLWSQAQKAETGLARAVCVCVCVCVAMCGCVWLCGRVWPCVVVYGCVWLCVVVCGRVWFCVAVSGHVWPCSLGQAGSHGAAVSSRELGVPGYPCVLAEGSLRTGRVPLSESWDEGTVEPRLPGPRPGPQGGRLLPAPRTRTPPRRPWQPPGS